MFGKIPAPEAFVTRLIEATGGIPHAVVEVVRMLVASGDIEVIEGKWRFRGGSEPFDIPLSLEKFYANQFELFDGAAKSVAVNLALIDRPTAMREIAAIHNESAKKIAEVLSKLNDRGIIRRETGRVVVANSGIRNAIRGSIPGKKLKTFHLQIAESLENLGRKAPGNLELANHFIQGGKPRKALKYGLAGIKNGEQNKNRIRAIRILERLRKALPERSRKSRAQIVYALAHARDSEADPKTTLVLIDEYRKAVPKKEHRERRATMERLAARCHRILNQDEKADEAWKRAIRTAKPGSEQHLRAISDYSSRLEYRGLFDQVEKLLLNAVEKHGNRKNIGMIAILSSLSRINMRLSKFKEATKYLDRAIELGSNLGEEIKVEFLALLAIRRYFENDIEEASRYLEQARQGAIEQNRHFMLAMLNNDLAVMYFRDMRYEEAIQLSTEAETIWRRYGDFRSLTHLYILLGSEIWYSRGSTTALHYLEKGLECARISSSDLMEYFILGRMGECEFWRGNFKGAVKYAEEGIRKRDTIKMPLNGKLEILIAVISALKGDRDTAFELAEKGLAKTPPADQEKSNMRLWVAHLALTAGDMKLAYEQMRAVEPMMQEASGRELFNILASFFDFWFALGQNDLAYDALEKLLQIPETNKFDLLRAESSIRLGKIATIRGRYTDAEVALRKARHIINPDLHITNYFMCLGAQVELELRRKDTLECEKRLYEFDSSVAAMPSKTRFYEIMSQLFHAKLELLAGNREDCRYRAIPALEDARKSGFGILELEFTRIAAALEKDEEKKADLLHKVEELANGFAEPFEKPLRGSILQYFLADTNENAAGNKQD
jgi:tetratricopeptide (TPR) repeat protein